MKWFAFCLVIACAGCTGHRVPDAPQSSRPSTAHWKIALSCDPAAPRQLDPTQFRIQLTDTGGKPISGASVTVRLTMPAMEMGRNQVSAQAASAGMYTGTGRFTMAGDWLATVQADKGTLHQSQSFPVMVQ